MKIYCAKNSLINTELQIVNEIIQKKKLHNDINTNPETKNEEVVFGLFETEQVTDVLKTESLNKTNKIIYSIEDIRITLINKIKHDKITFDEINNLRIIEDYIFSYTEWLSLKNILILRKDLFYSDTLFYIYKIASYLGVELTKNEIQDIETKITNIESDTRNQFYNKNNNFKFSNFFSNSELKIIEQKAKKWLVSNGFILETLPNDFLSYSQHGEDFIIWELLDRIEKGIIVEVGAFDGIHLSNSYALERIGWQAICIEPNPDIYYYLLKNRPKAKCLPYAIVGDETINEIEFYSEEIGVLSGIKYNESDIKKRYKKRSLSYNLPKKTIVKAKVLNSILNDLNITKIDVISIDVEGYEINVLQGFDIEFYKPKILIIEANCKDTELIIINYMKKFKKYSYIGKNKENLFFRRKTILNALKKQINFKNKYNMVLQLHPKGQLFAIESKPLNFENK